MNLFCKRPLLLALFFFLTTSTLCAFATTSVRLAGIYVSLLVSALLLCVSCLCQKHLRRAFFNTLLCASLCLCAFFSSHSFFDRTLSVLENLKEPVTVVAEIKECTFSAPYSTTYTAKVETLDGDKQNFSICLSTDGDCVLKRGNRIQAVVRIEPFSRDIHGYDERSNNIAKGVLVLANFSEYTLLADASPTVESFFYNLRQSISDRIDTADMPGTAPLIKALLLGITEELEPATRLNFRRLGISHILSISGTHFTILLGMVMLVLSAIGLNKRVIYVLLIPLSLFYIGLTGFSPAVCRAGIMAVLSYWGFLSGRLRDSYTALFFAVSIILLLSPHAVLSIGLWLSFTATFSILIFMELFFAGRAQRKTLPHKILFIILSNFVISVSVSFFTLPITAACFGEISVITPLANLLLVPLFELFLYIAPSAVLFCNTDWITKLTEWIGSVILRPIDAICEADGLLVSVHHIFIVTVAVAGCIGTLLLIALPLKHRGLVAMPAALGILSIVIFLFAFYHAHGKETYITYFTSGDNDGIVLTDNNNTLCIDISNGGSAPAYKAEYIAAQNYSPELCGYMFTHYHDRHIQQFLKVSNRTNIQAVYLPISDKQEDLNRIASIAEIAENRSIRVVRFAYGEPIEFESCTVLLYPLQDIKRSTHDVLCLKILAKDKSILYLGSSYHEMNFALQEEILRADLPVMA